MPDVYTATRFVLALAWGMVMRNHWAVALLALTPMLALHDGRAHAQEAQAGAAALDFLMARALPQGRAFTFGVITGVAGNWAYAALPNALKPRADTPPPAPAPAPNPPGVHTTLGPPPSPPTLDLPDFKTILEKPCPPGGCTSLTKTLFDLDQLGKQTTGVVRPVRPTIGPPPPPPECEQGMPGMAALKRAVDFDDGTLSWKRNAAAAEACYYVAARQDIPLAQYDLADMLLTGDDDIPVDLLTGVQWMEAAARNGFVPAQTRLAIAYETGQEGAEADLQEAAYWYAQAGSAGDAYAQYQMARFNYYGMGGMKHDWVAAFYWLDLALKQRFAPSGPTMDDLLGKIENDARADNPGALYVMGIAYQVGVPGRINPDAHNAFLAYRDAQRLGWNNPNYNVADALNYLCQDSPQACY